MVETFHFNAKFKKHLYQETEPRTKSSDPKKNKTQLIAFTTCIRALPFLENSSTKYVSSLIVDSLKSIYFGRLSPSHMLEYYHNHCTCAVE